ncbi:MAG: DUF6702 family protein [Rhodothermales bacterium]|nr:DUF6702 family protein [Rhodothermales bacterium]
MTRALVLLGIWLSASMSGDAVIAHDYHVTYGRMAIEGTAAACEIRFFKHDLEDAVALHSGTPEFRLGAGPKEDSLFVAYLDSKLKVWLNGVSASARLVGSGEEMIRDEEMWWYLVDYAASAPITRIEIQNRLLFERFGDQRNMIKVEHFPSETQTTFYFVPDSDRRSMDLPG